MTRRILLLRHAMPDIPLGERWCIGGQCDLPLGRLGRIQAARLPFMTELNKIGNVFSSSLHRAVETAQPLCSKPIQVAGLEEQRMGLWDGLSFREIQARWPKLYAARETNPSLLPEGAESPEAVRQRMEAAVFRCLHACEGDLLIVSHKSAIASLTGHRSRLGYASLSVLRVENGVLVPERVGIQPLPEPDDALCLAMLKASGAEEKLIAHCLAVTACADELCAALLASGLTLDSKAVHRAALLHDLAKGEAEHALVGGQWLRELGYPLLADIVRQHTEPDSAELNEAGLVFLADKLVRGDRRVSLEDRFAASMKKCLSPEAKAAHARRQALAISLAEEINRRCQSAIINIHGT